MQSVRLIILGSCNTSIKWLEMILCMKGKIFIRHVVFSFLPLKLRFPVGSLTDVREVSALVSGHDQLHQSLRQTVLRYWAWIRQNYE